MDCNRNIDDIYVFIYDDNGDKIDSLHFENENEFEYEYTDGEYEAFLQISHQFESGDEIECELVKDGAKNAVDYDFTRSSSIGDLRVEFEFDKRFEFDCDDNFDKIELLIFDSDHTKDEVLDKKTYTNVDKISYVYNSKDEVVEKPIPVEPDSGIGSTPSEPENIVELENVTGQANTGSLNTGGNKEGVNVDSSSQTVPDSKPEIENLEEGGSGLGLFIKILLGVIVLVLVFTYFLGRLTDRKPSYKTHSQVHRQPKKDIDFSFLNKKKK